MMLINSLFGESQVCGFCSTPLSTFTSLKKRESPTAVLKISAHCVGLESANNEMEITSSLIVSLDKAPIHMGRAHTAKNQFNHCFLKPQEQEMSVLLPERLYNCRPQTKSDINRPSVKAVFKQNKTADTHSPEVTPNIPLDTHTRGKLK